MSNAVQTYWQRVGIERAAIKSSTVFITSLDNPERGVNPGAVCEVTREYGARRLAERTHRLASPAEIRTFHEEQAVRDRDCRIATERQKERSVLALTPELAERIGMLSPHIAAQADGSKRTEATAK